MGFVHRWARDEKVHRSLAILGGGLYHTTQRSAVHYRKLRLCTALSTEPSPIVPQSEMRYH